MTIDLDVRREPHLEARPEAVEAAGLEVAAMEEEVSRRLPGGHRLEVEGLNPYTRMPATVVSHHAQRTGARFRVRASEHLERIAPLLTPAGAERLAFLGDPSTHVTSAGIHLVRMHQHVAGVPVFEGARVVRFDRRGRLESVFGDNAPVVGPVALEPAISAADAVLGAARFIADRWPGPSALKVTGYRPHTIARFALPSRPTVLRKRPFADRITAELLLFYHRPRLRLCWWLTLPLPSHEEEFEVIVLAGRGGSGSRDRDGGVLLCRSVIHTAARGPVFRTNPGEGAAGTLPFPPALGDFPAVARSPLPDPFPAPWITEDRLDGNNAFCLLGNARRRSALRGAADDDGDGDVAFSALTPQEQWQINAFYWVNYLHDFFFLLGFDEVEGNFQAVNFSGQGEPEDELEVRVFDKQLSKGIASIRSRADGKPCELNLGGIDSSDRHTALDADILIHEYVHGVANRMAGGPTNRLPLDDPQSAAMAEGMCDFFAVTIQNHGRAGAEEVRTVGAWTVEGSGIALRTAPYDDNHRGHFGRLGDPEFRDPHHGGEIWCLALLRAAAALGTALGDRRRGYELAWQLVIDSLKLLPVGADKPSFLEGRDALFQALEDLIDDDAIGDPLATTLRAALRDAFTALGMGPLAQSDGASLDGVVADFGGGATP